MKIRNAPGRLLMVFLMTTITYTVHSQSPVGFIEGQPYRLTTQWLGEGRSLAADDSGAPRLMDTQINMSQYWYLVPGINGYYRITSVNYTKPALDIINDGVNNRLTLNSPSNYSGQFWKLTPIRDSYYRITSLWLGDNKSLDVVNDGRNRDLVLAPTGNYTGQYWKVTPVSDSEFTTAQFEAERTQAELAQLERQRLEEMKRQQTPAMTPTSHFTVGIDCKGYSTLTNTETQDLITVTFVDAGGFIMGEFGSAITNCDTETFFNISGTSLAAIQIRTQGSDAFWIDRVWLLQDGQPTARWGKNEGNGYCLSNDPEDAKGGFKNFIDARGCKPCVRYDVTTQQAVDCQQVFSGK